VIVRGQGTIFLAGPPLVQAATGEIISAEELGGGDLHGRKSGVVDHVAEDDDHAITILRDIAGTFAPQTMASVNLQPPRPPRYDPCEIYGIIPQDVRAPYDVREVIARIVDDSAMHEFKPLLAALWSAVLRISGACRWRYWPTMACCSAKARSRARISSNWRASGGSLAVSPKYQRFHGGRQI
jgi:acetyl-CoA carboxylase carboxyltransferase component